MDDHSLPTALTRLGIEPKGLGRVLLMFGLVAATQGKMAEFDLLNRAAELILPHARDKIRAFSLRTLIEAGRFEEAIHRAGSGSGAYNLAAMAIASFKSGFEHWMPYALEAASEGDSDIIDWIRSSLGASAIEFDLRLQQPMRRKLT